MTRCRARRRRRFPKTCCGSTCTSRRRWAGAAAAGTCACSTQDGREVVDPFLPLEAELWNGDRTRYTLFFDPGRVKTGIRPNDEMGRALVNGRRYTLVVDADWRDAYGRPLAAPFRHEFRAGPAIETALDPLRWTRQSASRRARAIRWSSRSRTRSIKGCWRGRLEWRARPASPRPARRRSTRTRPDGDSCRTRRGRRAAIASSVLGILEDPSGNRIGRAFEIGAEAGDERSGPHDGPVYHWPMTRLSSTLALLLALTITGVVHSQQAQPRPLRIIAFGAHPDDAELKAAGVAALWAAKGHKVKFVAMTNGDVGHFEQAGGPLAQRRYKEVQECARILGITTDVLDIHDGELEPTLEYRRMVARKIRDWQADIVMGHRPYDYHPDHRYTGVLMDDAAVVVVAPFFVPDTTPTPRNPLFFYYSDGFEYPAKFVPTMVVDIDAVRRQEVAVRLGDAVAVRRQGLVAGPHAARCPEDRRRAARVSAEPGQAADGGRGRSVSRQARGDLRRGARPQGQVRRGVSAWAVRAAGVDSKN